MASIFCYTGMDMGGDGALSKMSPGLTWPRPCHSLVGMRHGRPDFNRVNWFVVIARRIKSSGVRGKKVVSVYSVFGAFGVVFRAPHLSMQAISAV